MPNNSYQIEECDFLYVHVEPEKSSNFIEFFSEIQKFFAAW